VKDLDKFLDTSFKSADPTFNICKKTEKVKPFKIKTFYAAKSEA